MDISCPQIVNCSDCCIFLDGQTFSIICHISITMCSLVRIRYSQFTLQFIADCHFLDTKSIFTLTVNDSCSRNKMTLYEWQLLQVRFQGYSVCEAKFSLQQLFNRLTLFLQLRSQNFTNNDHFSMVIEPSCEWFAIS